MAVKKPTTPTPIKMAYPSGTFISTKQVAEILGCGLKTVYDKIDAGDLAAYRFSDKPGSALRVLVDDVYAMLTPVIPEAVMADIRSRQPSPLHTPVSEEGGQ